MDEFQLLRPEDVDRVLGSVHSITTPLGTCPFWLIGRSVRGGSHLDPGGREYLLERGSGAYHLERGGNLTTPKKA